MNVIISTLTEEACESRDYRGALKVEIDGEVVFKVSDGEAEDANLSRDFSDCYNISDIIKQSYSAGKNGEEFKIEYKEVEEI